MRHLFFLFLWLALHFSESPSFTQLTEAARAGDIARVRSLVARGADPNERAGLNGWTPLMHAIHKNQLRSVAALIDAGANPNIPGLSGDTPLMMAAGYGQTPIVRLLLSRGAHPRQINGKGETALDFALTGANDIDDFTLFRCQDETARVLIAAGAEARRSSVRFAKLKRCVTP